MTDKLFGIDVTKAVDVNINKTPVSRKDRHHKKIPLAPEPEVEAEDIFPEEYPEGEFDDTFFDVDINDDVFAHDDREQIFVDTNIDSMDNMKGGE